MSYDIASYADLIADLGAPTTEARSIMVSRARAVPAEILDERSLTADDFIELENRRNYSTPPTLQKLRATHHKLARLIAAGENTHSCSVLTGYCAVRIGQLLADPMFQELVNNYRTEMQGRVLDVVDVLQNTAMDALLEFRERLELAPEEISPKDLLSAAKLGLDRTGHGPSSTQVNLNANLSDEKLAELHRRAQENSRAEIIIGTAHRIEDEASEISNEAAPHLLASRSPPAEGDS